MTVIVKQYEYLTTREVADFFALTTRTIAAWRERGEGPAWEQHGNRVMYRMDTVQEWIDQQREMSA